MCLSVFVDRVCACTFLIYSFCTVQLFLFRQKTTSTRPSFFRQIALSQVVLYRLSPELDIYTETLSFPESRNPTPLHVTAQRCSSDGRLRPSIAKARVHPRPPFVLDRRRDRREFAIHLHSLPRPFNSFASACANGDERVTWLDIRRRLAT